MATRAANDIRKWRSARLYGEGLTLREIAPILGVSIHSVANDLKRAGVNVLDIRALKRFGCTHAALVALNEGLPIWQHGSLARAYATQIANAKLRGVEWAMTFPEWVKVWRDSGRLAERRRGNGYVMARHGDIGPYHVNNVYIALSVQNIRDGAAFRRARKQAKAA